MHEAPSSLLMHTDDRMPPSPSTEHSVHLPAATSHTGFGFTHSLWLPCEHSPHTPLGWHAGLAGSGQSLSVRQPAHTPAGTLHSGFGFTHSTLFDIEHSPHAPLGWHA